MANKVRPMTELELRANTEARHAHRELVEQADARVAEVRPAMTDLTTIVIKDVEENEDGSATYTFDIDSNSSKKITELGLEFVLTCAAYNMDIQEALTIISEYGRGRSEDDDS